MGVWYEKTFKDVLEKNEEVGWLQQKINQDKASLKECSQTLLGTFNRNLNISINMEVTADNLFCIFVQDEAGKEWGCYVSDGQEENIKQALDNAFEQFETVIDSENKTIDMLVYDAYRTAMNRGWHTSKVEFGTLLALVHTEVTEAIEATTSEHLAEELADIVIRIFDLCGYYELDLQKAFLETVQTGHVDQVYSQMKVPQLPILAKEYVLNIHTPITKVMELYRLPLEEKMKNGQLASGLMEVILNVFRISYMFGLNDIFLTSLFAKMEKNKKRSYKHGGKIV